MDAGQAVDNASGHPNRKPFLFIVAILRQFYTTWQYVLRMFFGACVYVMQCYRVVFIISLVVAGIVLMPQFGCSKPNTSDLQMYVHMRSRRVIFGVINMADVPICPVGDTQPGFEMTIKYRAIAIGLIAISSGDVFLQYMFNYSLVESTCTGNRSLPCVAMTGIMPAIFLLPVVTAFDVMACSLSLLAGTATPIIIPLGISALVQTIISVSLLWAQKRGIRRRQLAVRTRNSTIVNNNNNSNSSSSSNSPRVSSNQ
jgi:hypothetical protein